MISQGERRPLLRGAWTGIMVQPDTPPAPQNTDVTTRPAELAPATANHLPTPRPIRHLTPIRLVLFLAVALVSLFLFLRTFAVEPFGVPTGSMAPALIGNHRGAPCPRCGYPVRVGCPVAGGNPEDHFSNVGCPSCGKRFSIAEACDLNGDRLLVDKNVFNLRTPRRWEMAVFYCPDPDPKEYGKPYVKRVVGLPGESISIIEGDAFANGVQLRKTMAEVRETRVIVYDSSHVPLPDDWNSRWLLEQTEHDPPGANGMNRSPREADDRVVRNGVLSLDAAEHPIGLTYRQWNLDEKREEAIRAWSSYDGVPRSFTQLPPAHDFSIECDIEVTFANREASFACRLLDGEDAVSAEITVGPCTGGRAMLTRDGRSPLGTLHDIGLEPGRSYRFEFAFVDRRAAAALDGKTILSFDLGPHSGRRVDVSRPLQLGARGCKLVLKNLKLYRDTHYTSYGDNGIYSPTLLGPDEYFMLGDNSGNSQDSRKWPRPGVPEADFIGKPFLIHQPLKPARVSVGGRDRVFQTLDWSRLRWIH